MENHEGDLIDPRRSTTSPTSGTRRINLLASSLDCSMSNVANDVRIIECSQQLHFLSEALRPVLPQFHLEFDRVGFTA